MTYSLSSLFLLFRVPTLYYKGVKVWECCAMMVVRRKDSNTDHAATNIPYIRSGGGCALFPICWLPERAHHVFKRDRVRINTRPLSVIRFLTSYLHQATRLTLSSSSSSNGPYKANCPQVYWWWVELDLALPGHRLIVFLLQARRPVNNLLPNHRQHERLL